jgi:hypothetical protein
LAAPCSASCGCLGSQTQVAIMQPTWRHHQRCRGLPISGNTEAFCATKRQSTGTEMIRTLDWSHANILSFFTHEFYFISQLSYIAKQNMPIYSRMQCFPLLLEL